MTGRSLILTVNTMSCDLQLEYYQYYNINNTGNTSIVNITILVIPVL
jgi:hypothetical protein